MITSQYIENAPRTPGVYLFFKKKEILYVGKAGQLRNRLSSYFRKDTLEKARRLIRESSRIEWRETNSEIEALIREAELIKKHRPKFNVLMRDDKNYFYVGITREGFSKVFITHQPHRAAGAKFLTTNRKLPTAHFIGPFTGGSELKIALKLLRKIFPYCTCKTPHKRLCLNAQIDKCPGYCCLKREGRGWNVESGKKKEKAEYRKNIRNIKAILTGEKKNLVRELKKEMRSAAKKQEFEKAALLRDQMESVENIFQHRLTLERPIRSPLRRARLQKALGELFETSRKIQRAEAYDIADISGTAASGSMVVFVDGRPAKAEYRIFNIRTVAGISDVDMMKEVVARRLRHSEWQYPDFMVIDGGKGQLSAALSAVRSSEFKVPSKTSSTPNSKPQTKLLIVALAKREEELYFPNRKFPVRLDSLPSEAQRFFKHIRDEAHRFAVRFHRQRRRKALLEGDGGEGSRGN